MGDKTLYERVLNLEQSLVNLEAFCVFFGEKVKVYDKYVIAKKKKIKALEKARRSKEAYRERKLGNGYIEAKGSKKKAKFVKEE